jgi:hypothetical protein
MMSGSALMAAPLLALEQISKRFGAIVIADRINLHLAQGEARFGWQLFPLERRVQFEERSIRPE